MEVRPRETQPRTDSLKSRVALAKSIGQVWIDADVTAVVLPSDRTPTPSAQRGTT